MDLTVAGDSNYTTTGTPDTATVLSNGPSGNDGVAENVNGPAKAITLLQALLGNALTLKGSTADLVTRLSRIVGADGAFAKGVAFPGTPIDGQPFYRTDLNVLYIYDAGSTSWTVGVDAGEFLKIDGSRAMTGDIEVRKNAPALRLLGLEGSAADLQIKENAGILIYSRNTGSESVPVWSEFFRITPTTGAILSLLYQLTGTGSFKSIFTHANTADRTILIPDRNCSIASANDYTGPSATGTGSSVAHSGAVHITSPQALSGVVYCSTFLLDAGVTVTADDNTGGLMIVATDSITINGTIDCIGAGPDGGLASSNTVSNAEDGCPGVQPGGGGGGGTSGGGMGGGVPGVRKGGTRGAIAGTGGAGTQAPPIMGHYSAIKGGASGGGAGMPTAGGVSGPGGRGGGSVVLVAPTIVLGAASAIKTSGGAGVGGSAGNSSGGGGGGAGNYYAACQSYTDGGCTFTLTGGAAGALVGSGNSGGPGADGLKQINIYP